MHRVIVPHPVAIEENDLSLLDDMSFVFIAIDHGPAKRPIMEHLEQRGIPFIDVGMGVSVEEGRVAGLVRTTLSTDRAGSREAARARISTEDVALGEYNTNIQIAELNALNAAVAVIMYKKQLGFYADTGSEHFSTYVVDSNDNINEDGPE